MAPRVINFNSNAAQDDILKEAMEWRSHRNNSNGPPDPDNVPSLNPAEVMAQIREIAMECIKREVRSDLSDKRRASGINNNVDDIE